MRFCDDCNLYVQFVSNKLDFEKYNKKAKCFATKIYNEDKSKAITIAGGIKSKLISTYPPKASFVFKFGAKSQLTEDQLKTIQWLRHFGTVPIMKDKRVKLIFEKTTEELFDRIVSILESEKISFIVE